MAAASNRGWAVITGGSRGIGRAIAEELAGSGFSLLLVAKTPKRLHETAKELGSKYGVKTEEFACDIGNTDEIDALHKFCEGKKIVPNLLVNNAGVYFAGSTETAKIEDYDQMMSVNTKGAFYLTHKFIPLLKKAKNARVVIISSMWAKDSYPVAGAEDGTLYAISKWAERGWAGILRSELRKYRIGVTAIYPGAVMTEMWEGTSFPEERFIDPKDMAKIVGTVVNLSPRTSIDEIEVMPVMGHVHE